MALGVKWSSVQIWPPRPSIMHVQDVYDENPALSMSARDSPYFPEVFR